MVLSAQHKPAVKPAPLGSGWVRASRMGPPGQGVLVASSAPATCPQAGQVSPAHPLRVQLTQATFSSSSVLWDSPATSMLLVHTRCRAVCRARSALAACVPMLDGCWRILGHAGAARESPQLRAG